NAAVLWCRPAFAFGAISRSAGHALSKKLSLKTMQHLRTEREPGSRNAIDARTRNAPCDNASQQLLLKQEVFHTILLHNIAVQHARLFLKDVSDPTQRESLAAQITTIEEQLKLVWEIASKL